MKLELTAVFRKVPEGYVGFVEELLVLEANRALTEEDLEGQEVIRESLAISQG